MEENNSTTSDSGKWSNKKLVRILIIVGIGIPVLVELLTLFNLINVQIFEGEQELEQKEESVVEVRKLAEGDTLFTDYASPVIVESMKVKVSARDWRFELIFAYPGGVEKFNPKVRVDSMRLNSGRILQASDSYERQTSGEVPRIRAEWELPSGDIPQMLFIRSVQAVSEDSNQTVYKEIPIGNIPVRYSRGES